MYQESLSYDMLFLRYMVRDRCNCYFSFWAISCPFIALTAQKIKFSKKKKQRNKKDTWRYHFTHLYQKLWLDDVRFLRYGAWQTDGQKKWHIEVGALPKKKSIFRTECNSLWDEKKNNCKPSSPIHTLIYRSNIYYSKIYKREDWKNSSSTLHLEVRTRYFRHRYSINSLELQLI